MLTLLPAVDVAGGRAVRLVGGDAGAPTTYGDPLDAALAWQRDGARWVHLVDLDAAFGRGSNASLLADVVSRLDVDVQLSGGIRDDDSLATALATGAARVVIGTAALEDPHWCERIIDEYRDRVAVGLDVRARAAQAAADAGAAGGAGSAGGAGAGWTLAARGSTRTGGDLYDALQWLDRAGCARYVVTDVSRDGTMTGPGLDLLRDVCARTSAAVIASGGVSALGDLRELAALEPLGVEGVIAGKALYAGAFTVASALRTLRDSEVTA